MARATTINPTRMELTRIKGRLHTARRGHKLLKDKRDELMRQFWDIVFQNRELRARVEAGLIQANHAMSIASAMMGPGLFEQALLYPQQQVKLRMRFESMVGISVPRYSMETSHSKSAAFPYSFAQTSGELDTALGTLADVFQDMLRLAEIEKTMQLLAEEIEKTRRRVNALEHVMIPEMQRNIKYITMKLEENDRSTKIRLMKVKDMVLKQAHNFEE